MTDWWAKANEENGAGLTKNTVQMTRAQNDFYMVVKDAASNSGGDHSLDGIKMGLFQEQNSSEMQQISVKHF